ncbi:MAG: hypothetical protein L0Y44_02435 [Phycisphaerales bacterium]|nr:hypothetical protein [Phycisphaerales bacterium]
MNHQSGSSSELGQDLLSRIVEQQPASADHSTPLSATSRSAVAEVARRYAGERLSLNPITVELLRAVLVDWLGVPTGGIETIVEQVAATLYEDPVSHDRLQAMWINLGGS